jgi:sortase A
MRKPLALLGLVLGLAAALFLGESAWIIAKAQVAQVLLEEAWTKTRTGETAVKPWRWADTWPVARLRVPRLGIDEIVLSGASGRTLAFGPGHLDGTAEPGSAGNVVLAGHRDTHFHFLRELVPGDEIVLETADGWQLRYRMTGTAVVDERDLRPLRPTTEATLTLVTCYPFDAVAPGGPLRFAVRAEALPPLPRARPALWRSRS